MPLYETVMQEKPPVVLDIGYAYTKLGFAAEPHPRKIIPTVIHLCLKAKTNSVLDYAAATDLSDQLIEFFQLIFFKHLLVSPKDRKIVIVENIFGKSLIKDIIARILFVHFEVSSILFVPTHVIALSVLAVPTAVVVDIGYTETTIMPVYHGVQIIQSFQDQKYGGHAFHNEIKRQLLSKIDDASVNGNIKEKYLSENILEDIKIRACFVTNFQRAQAYRNTSKTFVSSPPPAIKYSIGGELVIQIPGRVRETTYEIMFEDNIERDSLPHLIIQAILRSPIDVRKMLMENIFVIGGGAMIMGLLPRLKDELNYLVEHNLDYKEKLNCDIKFKFHRTIGRENITAWLGASLCGATDLVQTKSLTKDTYLKYRRVPDWTCLADNQRLVGS